MNVADNVAFGLMHMSKEARNSAVSRILEMVGLADLRGASPHQLSGGQQQRIALARALAPQPAVILLDEPFSNIDATLRARVRAEVREILENAGATAVFVTHDQEEALSLADKVAVMWEGRVLQVDTPEMVYQTPISREVAQFVGDMDCLPGKAHDDRVVCELGDLQFTGEAAGPVDIYVKPELRAATGRSRWARPSDASRILWSRPALRDSACFRPGDPRSGGRSRCLRVGSAGGG